MIVAYRIPKGRMTCPVLVGRERERERPGSLIEIPAGGISDKDTQLKGIVREKRGIHDAATSTCLIHGSSSSSTIDKRTARNNSTSRFSLLPLSVREREKKQKGLKLYRQYQLIHDEIGHSPASCICDDK